MHVSTLVLLACATIARAQSPDTFEVASIKLGDPLNPSTSFQFEPGGGIKIEGASLKNLVLFAYDLREFQLTGANGWMNSERYTILAKGVMGQGPADYRRMNDQQRKAMNALIRKRMQALLAERFHLAVHKETKELPIYALVIAKGGIRMQPNLAPDGSPQGMSMGRAMFKGQRAAMDGLANGLSGLTGRPIHDETGLTGFYDFKMEWTPETAPPIPGEEQRTADSTGPTLFTALQEQLGLKLESRKGPVEIVVIDRVERPSEN